LADNESVKETLEAINNMQADGVIRQYAIGGAVGATFYLEPAATVDLDVFVILPDDTAGAIDLEKLQEILEQSGLTSKWREFERRFLEGPR